MILKTLLTALISSVFIGQAAYAQTDAEGRSTFPKPSKPASRDEWRPHMGILAGYSDAEGGRYDSAMGYGVDWGIQPYIPFIVGAELASTTNEGDLTRTTLLGRGTYNFGGTIPVINHSYVGAMLGPVWDSESSNDGVRVGVGPLIGFDMPLGKEITDKAVTLGLNARYILVNEAVVDTFAVNGAMKYWF